ncbi:unnamed protein product [Rotaria magnacalcarata]|uniref:Uncharacterized protein n=1 Tax=Rotaria magnacalcarata TaxID=392030 RepID=A0A816L9W5_9BILA|nr:unnamed protein product [Rotaria magnacalcarata]
MYSNVVQIYLQKPIIEQILQYETIVENMLEKYIEDHFHLFDYDYDHDDEQLAHEIQQQLSHNSNQMEMIERLVSRKYELELWREEIQCLKNYQKKINGHHHFVIYMLVYHHLLKLLQIILFDNN